MDSLFQSTLHCFSLSERQKYVMDQLSSNVFICLSIMTFMWWAVPGVAVPGDGGDLFIRNCGCCHQHGGKAKPVNPADKAEVVWEKYFKRDRHPGKLTTIATSDELTAILEYLKNHAADSDFPEAAVIPKG